MPRHPRVAPVAVLLVCLAGTGIYARIVHRSYEIDTWLFWSLASLWAWMGVFSLACLCAGQRVLRWLGEDNRPPLEAAVQSVAVGVVVFTMGMYAGGALGFYGRVFAVALPAAMIAMGGGDAMRLLRAFARGREQRNTNAWELAAITGGVLCVAIIYLGALTPDALNYDSTWSHLVIAQEYARAGRIIPFRGNYNMGVPHLASLIHTWGYLVPGLPHPALRWMMALHNEFGLFLWTLAGVAAGIRRLLDRPDLRGAWAAFFLFPIIFVYDNNIGGASDHVAAFFAVPMLLAAFDAGKSFRPRDCAILAVVSAGACLTKYQAAYIVLPIAGVLAVRWTLVARNAHLASGTEAASSWRALWQGPLVLVGLGSVLMLPHFAKNVIFYGNPLYPFAQELFPRSYPSQPGTEHIFRAIFTDDNWIPKGTVAQKLRHALELFATFSFEPHYSFTKNFPSFGSLFTLLLPVLLFLKGARTIIVTAAVASSSILLWGYTYNTDRNLQLSMPLMAVVVGATCVRAWNLGRLARLGLIPIVALQIVWGGDAIFYSSHDRIRGAMDLFRSGFEGNAKHRLDVYRAGFREATAALPPNAVVLLHTSHVSLGIEREIIQDWTPFQGIISYDRIRTPRELYDLYRSIGITHIVYYPRSRGAPSKQEEVAFDAFITRWAEPVTNASGHRIMKMPDRAPPVEAPYNVAMIGMGSYGDGVYPIERLNTQEYLPQRLMSFSGPSRTLPTPPTEQLGAIAVVDAVFVREGMRPAAEIESLLKTDFVRTITYPGYYTLFLRGTFGRSD